MHGCPKSLICSISSEAHSALPNPVVGQWRSLGQHGWLTTYFNADLVQWCTLHCPSHTVWIIHEYTYAWRRRESGRGRGRGEKGEGEGEWEREGGGGRGGGGGGEREGEGEGEGEWGGLSCI